VALYSRSNRPSHSRAPPPYFENFGKRLIKSPKIYCGDSGLASYLLSVTSSAELERSPFLGALFEGIVPAEILKSQANQGMRKELYSFLDQQGLETSSCHCPTQTLKPDG
jgi:predicted AAA+ superfamily ATPase